MILYLYQQDSIFKHVDTPEASGALYSNALGKIHTYTFGKVSTLKILEICFRVVIQRKNSCWLVHPREKRK